jgi:GPI-anchor transamidase subunit T
MLPTLTQLLTLPTPDFTMPYNAIMIVSTLLGLFFGWLFNMLYHNVYLWQPGEELVGRKRRLRARMLEIIRACGERVQRACGRMKYKLFSDAHKAKQE